MADKLTLSDCMKYPNAKVIEYDFYNTGRSREYKNIMDYINKHKEYYDFTKLLFNCKLILRDISELTDEEKKHIDRLACINPIRYVIYESKELGYAIMEDDLQICDYLREKNIMIGKPDWFKSGKAVKG